MKDQEASKYLGEPEFYTVPEAAKRLGISDRSMWRILEDELLDRHEFGGLTRIARKDLESYIRRSRRRGPSTRKTARASAARLAKKKKSKTPANKGENAIM